jgi:hypothetical protein
MSDPTRIRGFQNVSTSRQTVFITEGGEAKIRQISLRRWEVLPRGGEAYEVNGKQEAIEEARSVATGLTLSHLRELQKRQQLLQSSILTEASKKKSRAKIKSEIDEVLAKTIARKAPTKELSSHWSVFRRIGREGWKFWTGRYPNKSAAVAKAEALNAERRAYTGPNVPVYRAKKDDGTVDPGSVFRKL